LTIEGKQVTVEPYGWANQEAQYNDKVIYQVNAGNIFWDVVLIETAVVPIWLTGWQFYEPVKVKPENILPDSLQVSRNVNVKEK
jgi:hypothetical protein